MTEKQLDEMVKSYAETMLWATSKYDEEPSDHSWEYHNYSPDELSEAARKKIREDCEGFVELVREDEPAAYEELVLDPSRAGHDFFLTRAGHGANFRDGDWQHGDLLYKWAKTFGAGDNLYVNKNGEVEIQ